MINVDLARASTVPRGLEGSVTSSPALSFERLWVLTDFLQVVRGTRARAILWHFAAQLAAGMQVKAMQAPL